MAFDLVGAGHDHVNRNSETAQTASNPRALPPGMYWPVFYHQEVVIATGPRITPGTGTEQIDVCGLCCLHNTRHQLIQFAHFVPPSSTHPGLIK